MKVKVIHGNGYEEEFKDVSFIQKLGQFTVLKLANGKKKFFLKVDVKVPRDDYYKL